MTTTAPVRRPSLADRLAARGDRVVRCDVYGAAGATVYDDLASADAHEVTEVLRLLRSTPGPVLDLAAGAGRFTLPLLAAGFPVTALDLSPHMLALLERTLAGAPAKLRRRCTVVEADMSGFALPDRFATVLLGTTSISLLDAPGRAGLYRSVLAHLRPGGRFVLSVLEHAADTAGTDAVTRVVGASGTAYDLYESWAGPGRPRTVTIVPAEPAEGPVAVCVGEVGTVGADTIRDELDRSGLVVTAVRPLTAPGSRHVVHLVEAGARP